VPEGGPTREQTISFLSNVVYGEIFQAVARQQNQQLLVFHRSRVLFASDAVN
jgi:hypothetical protein